MSIGEAGLIARSPWLSIIIPSYQMAPYLALTLESFRHVSNLQGVEIIVVDDGSNDDTASVLVRATEWLPSLRSIYRARDSRSCRALARNLGVAESCAPRLFFLDAGVMVAASFIRSLSQSWNDLDDVVLGTALGLFADRAYADVEKLRRKFEGLPSGALERLLDGLRGKAAWADPRGGWFEAAQGDLSSRPAPWLFAWSCALGVSKSRFEAVGGFDEGFVGWGAEDCDLALRLHAAGIQFRALRNILVMHVPHHHARLSERIQEHRANLLRLHEKLFKPESELFYVLMDPFAVDKLLDRFEEARIDLLLPKWDLATIENARGIIEAHQGVVIVGAPRVEQVAHLKGASWYVPNRSLCDHLRCTLDRVSVTCTFCCSTDQSAGAHEIVVLTDLIRLLPPEIQVAQLREAARIGKRVYLLSPVVSDRDAELRRAAGCWSFTSIESLVAMATQEGLSARWEGQALRLELRPRSNAGQRFGK